MFFWPFEKGASIPNDLYGRIGSQYYCLYHNLMCYQINRKNGNFRDFLPTNFPYTNIIIFIKFQSSKYLDCTFILTQNLVLIMLCGLMIRGVANISHVLEDTRSGHHEVYKSYVELSRQFMITQ